MTTSADDYCTAEHENALYGCYGRPNHEGNHWSWASKVQDETGAVDEGDFRLKWYWDDTPEAFTDEELAVLAVLVLPLAKLYPELAPKILRMKEALK